MDELEELKSDRDEIYVSLRHTSDSLSFLVFRIENNEDGCNPW